MHYARASNLRATQTVAFRYSCLPQQGFNCLRQSELTPPQPLPSLPKSPQVIADMAVSKQWPSGALQARQLAPPIVAHRRCDLHLLAQVHRAPTDGLREPCSSSAKALRHRAKLHNAHLNTKLPLLIYGLRPLPERRCAGPSNNP